MRRGPAATRGSENKQFLLIHICRPDHSRLRYISLRRIWISMLSQINIYPREITVLRNAARFDPSNPIPIAVIKCIPIPSRSSQNYFSTIRTSRCAVSRLRDASGPSVLIQNFSQPFFTQAVHGESREVYSHWCLAQFPQAVEIVVRETYFPLAPSTAFTAMGSPSAIGIVSLLWSVILSFGCPTPKFRNDWISNSKIAPVCFRSNVGGKAHLSCRINADRKSCLLI